MNPQFFQPLWDLLGIRGWSSYATIEWIPFILATPITYLATRYIKIDLKKTYIIQVWMFYVGILGSKLFHILFDEKLDEYVSLVRTMGFTTLLTQEFLYPWKGGQVFYGGILTGLAGGTLLAYFLYRGPDRRLNIIRTNDVAVFTVYMMSSIGRVGCYLQGCCYGAISETFGVVFPARSAAAYGVFRQGLSESAFIPTPPLIPTQLIETCTSGSIFLFLLFRLRKADQLWTGYFAWHALMFHAIARFCIEFLRIDRRGGFWMFSTSQWIAITVATILIIIRIRMLRSNRPLVKGGVQGV
ncbi:MAG TPA: prolipoprotein diacylglyceryl transferase [bacterium]|nr:prolipoprotein diacylglyceryl transferase [bacterium]